MHNISVLEITSTTITTQDFIISDFGIALLLNHISNAHRCSIQKDDGENRICTAVSIELKLKQEKRTYIQGIIYLSCQLTPQ